jgi:hypothetical protein
MNIRDFFSFKLPSTRRREAREAAEALAQAKREQGREQRSVTARRNWTGQGSSAMQPAPAWDGYAASAPASAPDHRTAHASPMSGHGGTFDGGGASGDWGGSSSSCSSSSSSDSGSSSSDSSSCGSGD